MTKHRLAQRSLSRPKRMVDISLPHSKQFTSCNRINFGPIRGTMVCLPENHTTTLFVPWQLLPLTKWASTGRRHPLGNIRTTGLYYTNHTRSAQSYGQKFTWYMTVKSRGWTALVAEDGNQWADWSSDTCARSVRPQIKLSRST